MTCWASIAADQHAADDDAAERRAEYVATFMNDAADECLCEEGNAAYLVQENPAIETLFLQLLWADKDTAFAKVCALRDVLRETAIKRWSKDVTPRAEALAMEALEDGAQSRAESRQEARQAFDAMFPEFPSIWAKS